MMINSSEKKMMGGVIILVFLVGVFAVAAIMLKVTPIERITYPEATNDLSTIKTWSKEEVYSFSDDLGCFDLPYNEEFENKFPEEVEFCREVKSIWAKKYDESKEDNTNWELYRSLEGGDE